MPTLPIIFLAFANEKTDDSGYLHNLAKEQRQLREILEASSNCEVIIRPNVTVSEIFDVFQKEENRGLICLFHYAGHANGFQLLLETEDGGNQSAHGEGLMSFLTGQKKHGLNAVVLNGCATENHASQLAEGGIATIATAQAINDDVAVSFSERLYKGIVNQTPLKQAFEEASSFILTQKGSANSRDLYWADAPDTAIPSAPWRFVYQALLEENLAEWTLGQSYKTLNISPPEKAKKVLSDLTIDRERVEKAIDTYLIKRQNIKKTLKFLSELLKGQNTWLDAYCSELLNQEKRLGRIQIREGHEAYEKARNSLMQEIILIFR